MIAPWIDFAARHWPALAMAAAAGAALAWLAARYWPCTPGYNRPFRPRKRHGPAPGERLSTGMQRRIHTLESQNLELVRLFVMLPDLARELSTATERAEIVRLLVGQTQDLFPEAPSVAFFGPPMEPGMPLQLEHSSQPVPPGPAGALAGVPPGKGLVGQAFATGETATHLRLRQRLSHFEVDAAMDEDPTPFPVWAAIPLIHGDTVLGVLAIAHPGRFWANDDPGSPDPLKLLGVVADVGAISLDHAANLRSLARMNDQLKVLDQLKSEFVSMVSHDLRTPLTAVKSALQNLADGVAGPLNQQQDEYLAMMTAETARLVRLINALLDLQRIEAGGVELARVRLHMRPLVERTLKVLRDSLQAKQIQTDLSQLPQDLAAPADPDRLSQVLFNLLDNACKFTPPGGRIVLQGEARAGLIVVGVTNSGPVISDEQAAVVFERFRQLRAEDGQRPKGAGLGLSIAKKLVTMHGGDIWVRGIPGTGTRFAFSLPAQEPS